MNPRKIGLKILARIRHRRLTGCGGMYEPGTAQVPVQLCTLPSETLRDFPPAIIRIESASDLPSQSSFGYSPESTRSHSDSASMSHTGHSDSVTSQQQVIEAEANNGPGLQDILGLTDGVEYLSAIYQIWAFLARMNVAPRTLSSDVLISDVLKLAYGARAACYANREMAYSELQNSQRKALNADVDIRDAEDSIKSLSNLMLALGPNNTLGNTSTSRSHFHT